SAAVLHGVFIGPGLRAGLAFLLWHGIPAPLQIARLGIVRAEVAGPIEVIAADARDDVILHDQRRDRAVVELVEIAIGLVPALAAILDIERNEITIRSEEVEPIPVHCHAAIPDVNSTLRLPDMMPELAAAARVDGPHVVGRRSIEDTVDLERWRLDAAYARPVAPCKRQP